MTFSLYVDGPKSCGKTLLSFGFIQKFRERKLRVSYFKPFSIGIKNKIGKIVDSDVVALKEVLGLGNPFEEISPIVHCICGTIFHYIEPGDVVSEIQRAYKFIKSGVDVVVIEGSLLSERYQLNAAKLSALLDSRVILVVGGSENQIVETTLRYRSLFDDKAVFMGTIINSTPLDQVKGIRETLIPTLHRLGIRVYGVVPQKRELITTVGDILETLNAKVLTGEKNLNRFIGDCLIADMKSEDGLVYWFRRSLNQTMMRGGDKIELILEAMEANLGVLIMSGDSRPTDRIVSKANEKGIPILLTSFDEFTTMAQLGKVTDVITPNFLYNKESIIKEMIEEHVDWKGILNEMDKI